MIGSQRFESETTTEVPRNRGSPCQFAYDVFLRSSWSRKSSRFIKLTRQDPIIDIDRKIPQLAQKNLRKEKCTNVNGKALTRVTSDLRPIFSFGILWRTLSARQVLCFLIALMIISLEILFYISLSWLQREWAREDQAMPDGVHMTLPVWQHAGFLHLGCNPTSCCKLRFSHLA